MNDTQFLILDAAALVSTERIRYKHSGFGATFHLPSHELDDRDLMRVLDELECRRVWWSNLGELMQRE